MSHKSQMCKKSAIGQGYRKEFLTVNFIYCGNFHNLLLYIVLLHYGQKCEDSAFIVILSFFKLLATAFYNIFTE